jgi:hypothetical protein
MGEDGMNDSDETRPSGVVLKGLAGVVLAALILYWLLSVRNVPTRVIAVRQCENAYHAARTAADTLAADSIQVVGSDSATGMVRCVDLKLQGKLE